MRTPTPLSLLAALVTVAPGQEPAAADGAPRAADLLVPIHRALPDPQSPDDALWAGGPSYKVAFGDGYTFFPVLGEGAPRNLPLRWRTLSSAVGGEPVAELAGRARRRGAWRYELVADGLIEAYDVLAEGVEQTFVLTRPPRGRGDWVVRGVIESELRSGDRPPRHGPVELVDADGRVVVTYGAALVFDAAGRDLPVTTAVDGGVVTMTVPAAWLAGATYPVTLDPLTLATPLATASGNTPVSSTAVGVEAESGTSNVMVVFSRAVSAADHDVYAMLMNADFSNRRTVFSDLTNANSDFDAQVAYVAGADRWLVGMQRDYTSGTGKDYSTIRTYYHGRGDLGLNTGPAFSIVNAGSHYTRPAYGGTAAGSGEWGVLVYQLDGSYSGTPYSDILVVPIRATTAQYWSAYVAGDAPSGTARDREEPAVTPVSGGGTDGWVVGWSEINRTGFTDDWDVLGVRLDAAAQKYGGTAVLASSGGRHSWRPRIAGSSGSYLLAYERNETLAKAATNEITARRVDWPARAASPDLGEQRAVIAAGSPTVTALWLESLAFDSRTRSHWALTYRRLRSGSSGSVREAGIARLGGFAGVTETATLFTSSTRSARAPSVAYDLRRGDFAAVYSAESSSAPYHPVYGVHFAYPAGARAVGYGASCSAARIASSPPYAGHANFAVSLAAAPAGVPASVFLALGPAAIPLDPFGIKGCSLLVDPQLTLLSLPAVTDGRGGAAVVLVLPNVPLFVGDLFAQWAFVAPGANPANLLLTGGLRMEVR